ncbi:uncharacterized protein C15orf39 homolog [Salarias fasciatus]|uniref:Uncharacterized protein n=1 Tax=Salarias fasciatus TaxID=181472 RepID=A0A672J6J3_SALFA|nr:uncharacterized protein C15orf39 homolog [Salarias fasciatus]XP_029952949.1 uncharacterized protein C15orf39 homolog [Salarias fasciatus]XP_029952950.1 uncharacterized protein C15orf39 homolog [Salarias fasciatus]
MGSESMQTITDPVLQRKMPIFDGTLPSSGLSKQPNMSAFLGKQALQYSGAYIAYDPRGKDGVRSTPPWSNSKTTLLDGRSPLNPFSGMMGQNHLIYRQDGASSEESHPHSSPLRHTPSKPGFMLYTKSPEISSPASAVSVGIRKQKSGCESSPSHSENSVYLAIPKPVYRHAPCCNELGCVIAPTYSVEHGAPRIPNTVYEREWMQSGAHYTELSPMQRKAQNTLLQQRGLQFEASEEALKRITVDAYSPGRTRTLPGVVEPTYSGYPCAPTRSLFRSLSEHGQSLQTSPRGYPGLISSHPTYERMTSEVYQEHSPMSKYGQLAQHPVFYYPQANVGVENRAQCKDSGSKKREDVPVVHKHPTSHPQEHYIVPQSLNAEIPLPRTEMLPTHSFMQGFEYPCYAVPRFHLDASQIRSPIKRPHASPSFHSSCINVSPSSQHKPLPVAPATSPHSSKPKTSLHADPFKAPSPFLLVDQHSPTRLVSQRGVSPASIQLGRFFSPLTGMHLDPAVFSPPGLSRDRPVDYSSCEAYPKQPKSFPVFPAVRRSHTPNHDSDRTQTAGPDEVKVRKLLSPVVPTVNRQSGSVLILGGTGHKDGLKRSISQVTPPIKIKEEDKDLSEVDLAKKQKMTNLQVGNASSFSPMPVIDTVFSLAPYLPAHRGIFPGRTPQRTVHTPEQPEVRPVSDVKEKSPDRGEQDPVDEASEEIHQDTVIQKVKNIKVEKVEPLDVDQSESPVPHTEYSEVIIKKELSDDDTSDGEPTLLKKTRDSDERDLKPSLAAQSETSDETKPAVLQLVNSSCQFDAHSPYEQTSLQPKSVSPVQLPQTKLNISNIPPQCLKLSRFKIVLPDAPLSSPCVLPSERPPVQPIAEPQPILDIHRPVRKHFLELHHSLCKLLSKSVSASSEPELKQWLSRLEITEPKSPSAKVQQVSCLLGVKAREVWINEEMKSALHEVLQRLNEYTAQERCPFPHVYRTGAVFLPMLVVKELLFPMVQGSFIDQVLQEHKVGLRPTTLSEEKILIQLHKRACSSKLRRLMSLKHLPDIYADVVNILYYTYVCKHLDPTSPDVQKQVQDQIWSRTIESKT